MITMCPGCSAEFDLSAMSIGDQVNCGSCSGQFEVLSLDPPRLG